MEICFGLLSQWGNKPQTYLFPYIYLGACFVTGLQEGQDKGVSKVHHAPNRFIPHAVLYRR